MEGGGGDWHQQSALIFSNIGEFQLPTYFLSFGGIVTCKYQTKWTVIGAGAFQVEYILYELFLYSVDA